MTEDDHSKLLQDIQLLSIWSKTWLMNFNVKKCGVLSITRKRTPRIYQYKLLNEEIPRVNEYKYLGMTITADLRWNKHCQNIRKKASQTLGLIRRTLSPCTAAVKSRAYTTLVRPQLEYGSEAWNPYTASNINLLEQVQKSAARFVQCDYRQTTSSSALVSALGWDSLHCRRLLAQCVLFFKIHHHLVNVPFPPEISQASYFGRQDHQLKYTVPRATIDLYKYSFYPRAIRMWNHLPGAVVTTADPTLFRGAALPILRTMQPPVGSAMM